MESWFIDNLLKSKQANSSNIVESTDEKPWMATIFSLTPSECNIAASLQNSFFSDIVKLDVDSSFKTCFITVWHLWNFSKWTHSN